MGTHGATAECHEMPQDPQTATALACDEVAGPSRGRCVPSGVLLAADSSAAEPPRRSPSAADLLGRVGGLGRRRPRPRPGRPRRSSASSAAASSASRQRRLAAVFLADGRLRAVGLGHQLDDRHRGVVALARTDLGDPGVATRTLGEGRRDLGEQRVHDRLVADGLEDLATVVQVALLRLGDQLLRERTQHARLAPRWW